MKTHHLLSLVSLFILSALGLCAHHAADHKDDAPGSTPLRGVVTDVLTDKKQVLIKHDEIPGIMKAMTMAFHVPDEIFPHLTKGVAVEATLLEQQKDGWHLADVRVVAEPGATLEPGIPYRVALKASGENQFGGAFTFSPPAAGDWRVSVSQRAAWIDLIPPGGKPVPSQACTHANPPGFAKGPLYALQAGQPYDLRISKATAASVDILVLPFSR